MACAVSHKVVFLWTVSCLLCLAHGGYNFSVHIATNAKLGTAVVNVRSLLGPEKAELPCAIVEGDPYGRFYVRTNCTVVVARPLDWLVQSEYLLKIRVGQLRDPDHLVVHLKVKVTHVLGYPPVYNVTCETPVRPYSGEKSNDFLFSSTLSVEAETTAGDVVFLKSTLGKPRPIWDMDPNDPRVVITAGNDCHIRVVMGVHALSDVAIAAELFQFYVNEEQGTFRVTCHEQSETFPDGLFELFSTYGKYKDRLRHLEGILPDVMVKLPNHPLIVMISSSMLPTKGATRFNCKLPSTRDRVVTMSLDLDAVTTLKHLDTITVDINPVGCPPDRYGILCDKNCICENGARCHGFNGACKCTEGWQGVACDIPKPGVSATTTPSDPSDIYIPANVTIHCNVHHLEATTLSLLSPNGSVTVSSAGVSQINKTIMDIQPKDGVAYMCELTDTHENVFNATILLDAGNCSPNRKGERCDETCECLQGASCDRWAGCVCPPGWTGTRCQERCPDGTYGKGCGKNCTRCLHGASCAPSDGTCNCTAGWYGSDCNVSCPTYRYGLRCQHTCTCRNDAACNNVDGRCQCVSPWTGENCDEKTATIPEPLVEILVPLASLLLLVLIVAAILYKKRRLFGVVPERVEENEALLELALVDYSPSNHNYIPTFKHS
ncbi:uncharacterized protein LOC118420752 [Branchiostoma floridae]|uniref:Uncharacterized protein LOC118420752 n=1 Tax=Branchiostoma floridae TaxID=7739 RepID=A0A9J7LIZ2_BRAFL|nr:uncharacterized protein LOC118420752 [Branchiostoma floridae]